MSAHVETSLLRLTVPARPEYLMFTRLVLTGLSRSVEIDPEALADLKLAVSEACSYAIRAGAPADGHLEIVYEVTGEFMSVTVDGVGERAWPVTAVEQIDDDLGLVVIEAVVDELEIDRTDGAIERISFRKRLEPLA